MKTTIKIKNVRFCQNGDGEVDVSELRRVIKEHPELLQEEKLPFVERIIWKEYWFIVSDGSKEHSKWINNEWDNLKLSSCNVFFTESDCDKEIAKRKALGNIMSYIRDNEIELVKDEDYKNNNIEKYSIDGWDYDVNNIFTDENYTISTSQHSLAFYSQEDREKIISNCAKDLETLLKK